MNQKTNLLFGLMLVFLQLSFSTTKESWKEHALYLGTLQLKYEAQSTEAYLDVKVFSDDLQSAIRNAYADFQAGPLNDLFTQNRALIGAYFEEHLQLKINDSDQTLKLHHHEQINDTHLLQFTISCPSNWKRLELTGNFFMELFPNQINVVSVSYLEQKQFARLSKQQPRCEALFNP